MKFKKWYYILPMTFLGIVAVPVVLASCSTTGPVNNETQTKPPQQTPNPPTGDGTQKPETPKPNVPEVKELEEEFDYSTGTWYKVYEKDSSESESKPTFYYLFQQYEYPNNNQFGGEPTIKYYGITSELDSANLLEKINQKADKKTFIKKIVSLKDKDDAKKFKNKVIDFKAQLQDFSTSNTEISTDKEGFYSIKIVAKQL